VLPKPFKALLLTHPFELMLAMWGILAGVPLVLGVLPSNVAMQQLNHHFILHIFGFAMTYGGVSIAIGLVLFYNAKDFVRQVVALRIEQSGWISMSTAIFVYASLVVSLTTGTTIFAIMSWLAMGGACLCRYFGLRRVIINLERAIPEEHHGKRHLD
jgi:hypothetical protein